MSHVRIENHLQLPHYNQSLDHHFLKTVNDGLQRNGKLFIPDNCNEKDFPVDS